LLAVVAPTGSDRGSENGKLAERLEDEHFNTPQPISEQRPQAAAWG
jgi:hypothetical protein